MRRSLRPIHFRVWVTVALLSCCSQLRADAPKDLAGFWEGAVSRDGAVQLLSVTFSQENGKLNGKLSIPELGLFEEPVGDLSFSPPKLAFRFIYGHFESTLHADTAEIIGLNAKWNPPVRLHLKRAAPPAALFTTESLSFQNGEVSLAGSLMVPATPGPHPAIVFVHGSGPASRSDWVYRAVPTFLARRGIATLIYDKRGVGGSTGNHETATFDDLVGDGLAGVAYLKSRQDIADNKIGIFGASQGGWLGPMAAVRSKDIAFVIMHAGPAVSVWDQERQSITYRMRRKGIRRRFIKEAMAYMDQVFAVAETGQGWDALAAATKKTKRMRCASFVQLPDSLDEVLAWRLQKYDPAPVLRKLKVPVLALYGGKDDIVPPEENVDRFSAYLKEAGNEDVTVKVFPGGDHGIETNGTLVEGRWEWPDGHWVWPRKAPGYFETIGTWVHQRTR